MVAHTGGGLPHRHSGLLVSLADHLRRVLRWRPGRYESVEEAASDPAGQAFVPAEAEPEHLHHAKFSVQELDAAIEDSYRTGSVDLDAAGRDSFFGEADPGKSRWGLRRSRRKPANAQPEPAPRQAKAFGGDLYPTAAHGTGRDVRYVKVATWSDKQNPAGDGPPTPAA